MEPTLVRLDQASCVKPAEIGTHPAHRHLKKSGKERMVAEDHLDRLT